MAVAHIPYDPQFLGPPQGAYQKLQKMEEQLHQLRQDQDRAQFYLEEIALWGRELNFLGPLSD